MSVENYYICDIQINISIMTKLKNIWGMLPLAVWALALGACSDDDTTGNSDNAQKMENADLHLISWQESVLHWI